MASKIANAGKHTILKEMIKPAMQEDQQALQYLDVEDSYVTPKSDLPPEWVGMKCNYRETVAFCMWQQRSWGCRGINQCLETI